MYLIVLDDNNRIVAARDYTPGEDIPDGHVPVDSLPPGDMHDYRYEDGEYVYDPIPEPVVYVTADRNYNKGDVATIDGVMYEFLANVPRGAKLVVGQNVAVTSFDEQIAKLKGE